MTALYQEKKKEMTSKTKSVRSRWKDIPENVKKVSAFISAIIVIVTACGSVLSWFEAKVTEHIDKRLSSMELTVNEIREDTVRLQLDNLINNDSENVESILTVAHKYFIEMKGDWYMTEKFKRWGREHNVDLSDFSFTHSPAVVQN